MPEKNVEEKPENEVMLKVDADLEKNKVAREGKVIRQFFACSCAYLLAVSNGASAGFSAVTIPQLQDKESGFDLSTEEISWFASLVTFAYILTCVLGGLMGQYFGRKRSMMLVAPISILAFLCQALAPGKDVLLFGRFLVGVGGGLVSGPCSTFVGEISSPEWRTTFGSGIGVFYLVGTLIIYVLGSFSSWRMVAALSALFSLGSLVAGILVPESPSWLVTKGYYNEAGRALDWLHGKSRKKGGGSLFFIFLTPDDQVQNEGEIHPRTDIEVIRQLYADSKLQRLPESNKDSSQSSNEKEEKGTFRKVFENLKKTLSHFLRADVWKPLLIMILLGFSQQFCGVASVSYYAVSLLMNTASSVNEYLATIIFGITRLLAQTFGSGLLLKFKRKHLFVVSSLITGVGMLLLGFSANSSDQSQITTSNNESLFNYSANNTAKTQFIFSPLQNETLKADFLREDESSVLISYLPLCAIILGAIGYHIGLSPITWSYMGELFPMDIRAEMAGFTNSMASISSFLVVKTYPTLVSQDHLGFQGTMWFYAAVCLLNVFIGIFILPETKGKRLDEITRKFSKKTTTKSETT